MGKLIILLTFFSSIVTLMVTASETLGQSCPNLSGSFKKSIVSITVERENKITGEITTVYGTGFIVSPEGFVLTANHVVERDETIGRIEIHGAVGSMFATKSLLELKAKDETSDVALLKFLDDSQLYSPIQLGCPWKIKAEAELCSLSFIAPQKVDLSSSLGILRTRNGEKNRWLTQMPSNPGESGAPVFDAVTSTVVAMKYGGKDPAKVQNINSLTPINLAEPILKTYVGISLPTCDANIPNTNSALTIEKLSGDQQTIPLGGWKNFSVKIMNSKGQPIAGVKVAWQTPAGGSNLYVGETDSNGISSATNLYTFPNAGTYVQLATIVEKNIQTGFANIEKISPTGLTVTFIYHQK